MDNIDNKKSNTIYQGLNQIFNNSGFAPNDTGNNNKIIIKGTSPNDVKRKGLELQQKEEIKKKFFNTTDHGFQKAMQYEAARLPAYLDYEGMEYYPLIASALDLFMEEATTIGENGKMLNIYSNKDRIKTHLEELFYDIVNVNVNLPFWTRNLPIKYDSIIPLLNGEYLTIEDLSKELKQNPDKEFWTYSVQDNTKNIVPGKIIWCDLTRKNSEILKINLDNNTYVETTPDHEFLLRNNTYKKASELKNGDSLMPFYTKESKFDGYERVYNPSTNHFKYTHTIDFEAINISNRKTKTIQLNHKVVSIEKIDNKYDVYCMEVVGKDGEQDRHNFPICSKENDGTYTRNGIFVSNCKYGDNFVHILGEKQKGITHIKQMVNYEIERVERIEKGKPKIKFKSREAADEFNVFEIIHFRLLGDDKYLPYGSCLLSDTYIKTENGTKKIKDIVKGDVVISFDIKTQKKITSNVLDVICNGEKQTYKISTVHNYIKATDNHKILIYDHNNDTFKYKFVSELKIGDGLIIDDPENKQTKISDVKNRLTNDFIIEKIKSIELDVIGSVYDIHVDNENHNFYANNIVVHNSLLNKVRRCFRQLILAEDAMLTYRLIRAGEKRVFKIDVGNIDDDDVEEYLHKVSTRFKKQQQVHQNDGQIDYRFNVLGNDEDWFLPVRNSNSQTGIETLPGATNLDQISDIEYLRDNLFTGLGVPKPFLGFQDAAGDGKNMAQMDVRFAKKINRIQQAVIQELNKLAIIHLYLLGFSGDDLYNFTLSLTNPSTQQEQLKVDLMQSKAQVYTELTRNEGGISAMSHTDAKKLLFNMSDKEIINDFKKQRMERAIAQELQDTPLIIKNTGVFDDVDSKYAGGESPAEGMRPEDENAENIPAGETPTGSFKSPVDLPPVESKQIVKPRMDDNTFNNTIEDIVNTGNEDNKKNKDDNNKKILKETINKNTTLNQTAKKMVNEINDLLGDEGTKINNNNIYNIDENQNIIDFDDLDIIDVDEIEDVDKTE